MTPSPGPCTARDDDHRMPLGGDPAAGAPVRASLALPPTLQAPAIARRFARALLHEWHVEDDGAYTAQLVVTELASNAVRHASGRDVIELALTLDGDAVTVALTDGSAIPPVVAELTEDAESGRGMWIVNRVAEEWGTSTRGDGKQVWARLRLARLPARAHGSSL